MSITLVTCGQNNTFPGGRSTWSNKRCAHAGKIHMWGGTWGHCLGGMPGVTGGGGVGSGRAGTQIKLLVCRGKGSTNFLHKRGPGPGEAGAKVCVHGEKKRESNRNSETPTDLKLGGHLGLKINQKGKRDRKTKCPRSFGGVLVVLIKLFGLNNYWWVVGGDTTCTTKIWGHTPPKKRGGGKR